MVEREQAHRLNEEAIKLLNEWSMDYENLNKNMGYSHPYSELTKRILKGDRMAGKILHRHLMEELLETCGAIPHKKINIIESQTMGSNFSIMNEYHKVYWALEEWIKSFKLQ